MSCGLIVSEVRKNIKIILRGRTRLILILCLIFPLMFLSFMWLVFGQMNFNYPMAVVIPDYENDQQLNDDLSQGKLPNLSQLLDYLNNNSLIGQTIVESHIVATGTSMEDFEGALSNMEISLIVVFPENFEGIIEQVKMGTWNGGEITIELHCLNINEDFLKNIYFGFQRKLKAYYDDVFPNEIEVEYLYYDADSSRETYPRLWTIGSGTVVLSVLIASMIIAASFIFNEKNNQMMPELAMSSPKNQSLVYIGKVFAVFIITMGINFPIGTIIIFSWIQIPFPVNFFGFLGIMSLSTLLGAVMGLILGRIIPEQVFTIPIAAFLLYAFVFLCGGFIDIEIFDPRLKIIIEWIPFTYSYSIAKTTIFTANIPPIEYIVGLLAYIAFFFLIGIKTFQKRVIHLK